MFHVKLLLSLFLLPIVLNAQHIGSTRLEVKELPPLPAVDPQVKEYINQYSETLNPIEKDWFYWTNYSRSNPAKFWDSVIVPILKVYPDFRNTYTSSLKVDLYKSPKLPFVKPNDKLKVIATLLASALAAKKANPSHTTPSGVTFENRMQSINIKKCAGENISFGPPNVVLMLVLLYVDEGVPDLGHRKTLLNPLFEEMGIGVGAYPDNKLLIVQDFSCNQK